VDLVDGLALRRPRPSAAFIHRQVLAVAAREGWPAPSYSSVHAIVRGVDPGLMTLAHDGAAVLDHDWQTLGLTLSASDFTDAEAVAAVARITGGNFRLIHRLFAQIRRVLEINELRTVTREVVEAARETLVIGS
jgi:hypothetical protein